MAGIEIKTFGKEETKTKAKIKEGPKSKLPIFKGTKNIFKPN